MEDDLETRAAALGLNEVTQRVWKETALPPTPSSPSPTFSPPSSPKQRRAAELTAQHAAAKLAESLRAECEAQSLARAERGAGDVGSMSCGSDSESVAGASSSLERQSAIAEWDAAERSAAPPFLPPPMRSPGPSSGGSSRKKRAAGPPLDIR